MIKFSNSKLLGIFSQLLILALIAKSISLILMSMMPSDGVSLNIKPSYQPKYQRVDFRNMLNTQANKQEIKPTKTSRSGINMTNMLLKGLYGTQTDGFVIIALKSTPNKTTILSVGEAFSGYRLVSIAQTSAMFTKNSTKYTLNLQSIKLGSRIADIVTPFVEDSEPISKKTVTRKDISYYAKNPKQIWKEISLRQVRDGKKTKGFKVTRIDPKSKFATMGLKKDDLLIKANNVELKSYRDALNIYTKIDKIDFIQIIIIRNGIEKEIVYEIN